MQRRDLAPLCYERVKMWSSKPPPRGWVSKHRDHCTSEDSGLWGVRPYLLEEFTSRHGVIFVIAVVEDLRCPDVMCTVLDWTGLDWTVLLPPGVNPIAVNKYTIYRGDDKSLARPGRKQATAIEDFEFHISYL